MRLFFGKMQFPPISIIEGKRGKQSKEEEEEGRGKMNERKEQTEGRGRRKKINKYNI